MPDNSTTDNSSAIEIAGIFRRLSALVYDIFLIAAIWFVVAGITVIINGGEAMPLWLNQFFLAPLLVLCTFMFYFWFWTHGGQTLGMRAWRLKIIGSNNSAPNLQQCLKRFIVAIGTVGLGFLLCLFRSDKSALQDLLSQTQIISLPKQHF